VNTPEQEFLERLQGISALKPTAPSEDSLEEKELLRVDPDAGTPVSLKNFLIHHDTHPIVLDFAMLRAFQLQWLGWEPETLWSETQRYFESQISELTRAKLQTLRTIHISNGPWHQWQVFEKIIQGLNNNIPRWDIMQAPGLEQLYAGIDMLDHLRQMDFNSEVRLYMAASILHEEVSYVPPPLDFLQIEVSQPYYHCRDCGSEDSALFSDGTCDTCTKKFSPEQGLSMQPKRELIQAGKGKNLELLLKFDPDLIEEKWGKIKDLPSSEIHLEDSQVDIQIAKLLIARDYMNIRRRQLATQLTGLKSWLETT
jgi:hypothetical protein